MIKNVTYTYKDGFRHVDSTLAVKDIQNCLLLFSDKINEQNGTLEIFVAGEGDFRFSLIGLDNQFLEEVIAKLNLVQDNLRYRI